MPSLYEITPFSLLDYPGEMACIAWFAGCNMRCVYCHNPKIVEGKGEREEREFLSFLDKRVGKLSAVVFSGGEATLYAGLPDLIRKVKALGFKIKLDTNGSRPQVLRGLLAEGLLNYVAMDYKCPQTLMEKLVGTPKLWEPFRESLSMLIEQAAQGSVLFEVRTTIHPDLMSEEDLNWMIRDLDQIGYKGTYYLQNIAATGDKTIGNVAAPERKLDQSKLIEPSGFKLGFRNF
ncbi:MAG: anaerobic ribonucleoside-triphosphate reductase activating protein [Alphaproteobacteria bacterium]|nr:anaerobic ribonucleoside-triphosphate reductase activating protein [Alphaproteobacteria bacterium]